MSSVGRSRATWAPVLLAGLVVGGVSIGGPRPCLAGPWVDARHCGPFVCRADFPLSGYEELFLQLAQLQIELVERLRIRPAAEPVEVYLFRDERSYRRFLQRQYPSAPYRRALFVKANGPGCVMAYRSGQFEVDIRHECTHALLHASLPMVPLWLDEGLAEYFEVAPDERAFDNPHLGSLRWAIALGRCPRLENLEGKGDLSEMGRAEYRDAWAWVHFLLHGPEPAREELVRFLSDIQAHNPPGLLSRRLWQRMPQLSNDLVAHFRCWRR
jgi:hypothetical protein